MNNCIKNVLLVLISGLLMLQTSKINAQYPDATIGTANFIQILKTDRDKESAMPFNLGLSNAEAEIVLNVHVLRDSNGVAGVSRELFQNELATVNETFGKIGIHFRLGHFKVLPEFEYASKVFRNGNEELFNKYLIDSSINIFLFDSVFIGNLNYYALTFFPGADYDAIYLRKDFAQANPLITQLGHFFGLLSTHDQGAGQELVDGSNCDEAGDLICDTYADPNVFGQINDYCEFVGAAQDSNGEWYVPSVANFMSEAWSDCKCVFTELQYKRIYYYLHNYKAYLR